MAVMTERVTLRDVPTDPACPKCGRRYAVKFLEKGHQHARFFCDPARGIGGCGTEYGAK